MGKKEIETKLNSLDALATIMDTLYTPLEQLSKDRKCNKNEAIAYKEAADKYLRKCGAKVIRKHTKDIRNILKQWE